MIQVTQSEALEILKGGKNVFLTGQAGTGKTWTMQQFIEWCRDQDRHVIITAPTGIAAINVGGATIHSSFKVYGYYPEHRPVKRQMIRWNLVHTVIIDEISMVGPDMLDEIDYILKQERHDLRPFGGVQVILVGDPKQLPPVYVEGTDSDKASISQLTAKYGTLKFDYAESYRDFTELELYEVKRAKDPELIRLLNEIRSGKLSSLSQFKQGSGVPECVHLFPYNKMVDSHNFNELIKNKEKAFQYDGKVYGNFDEKNCITPIRLQLKKGARVMVTKNLENGLVNGDLGTVTECAEDFVRIKSDRFQDEFKIEKAEWKQIEYQDLEEVVTGRYVQIPLKLGYALTIHKSQGLTLEHVTVHATKNVSPEMLYVALSRAVTYEDLYVKNH